uniref:Ectonucleoside triphosphate diphosphohydrolase 3 n=1 Tax=Varanus komodoensis TaxID=61221 RepID=A0A8D2KSN2_VARKO
SSTLVMGQCPPLGLRWTGCMVCAALSCYTSAPVRSPIRRTYGIVLDAGSSRTTAYVYEWPAEKENNTGVVSQTFKCNVKGPGISSYGNNPREIAEPINDCMNKVKEKIPSHLHSSTPVYLGATAGMRLLRSQNESAASEVLESIQNYFTSQPFDFRGAKIITGQAEGVYGWITANYLKGNFLEVWLGIAWVHPHGAETTGALDLGGASTQISFIPEESTEASDSMLQVQLYGYPYKVYTHSFQCYGRDEAEKTLLASILRVQSRHCCSVGTHLYGSLCTEKLITENYNASQLVTVVGTGDPTLCREAVSVLFNFTSCRDKKDCSFNGIHQPKIKGNFVAFSGFYYTVNALNLTGQFSLRKADLQKQLFLFFWKGPKLRRLQILMRFLFVFQVGNSSIAWSLGYMLNLTNMIPAESDRIWFPMNPSLFAGLLFFFTAVVLLCLIFLVYSCVVHMKST